MKTVEVKVSELQGAALDWAVAEATHAGELKLSPWADGFTVSCIYLRPDGGCWANHYSPSTDWDQGGPLVDRYDILILGSDDMREAGLGISHRALCFMRAGFGQTKLIAACRAIVAAKLGDTVQIPAELA